MINWEKYRNLFPVVANQTYFMTAGGGAISQPVLDAIQSRYQTVTNMGGRAFVNGDVKARINGAGFDPLIAAGASKIGHNSRASMRAWL